MSDLHITHDSFRAPKSAFEYFFARMTQRHATYMYENSYWSHCQIPSGKTLWFAHRHIILYAYGFAYICWLLGLALNHFIPILSSYLAACRIPDTASSAGNNSPTLHPTTWNLSTDSKISCALLNREETTPKFLNSMLFYLMISRMLDVLQCVFITFPCTLLPLAIFWRAW